MEPNHIVVSWTFNKPMTRMYVYPESTETFRRIRKVQVLSTGCHCLHQAEGGQMFIVPPNWRYIVQEQSGGLL